VWSDTSLIRVASGWMRPDGRLFWMRSEPLGEIAPDEIMVRNRTVHYRIGADRTRTVEVMGFRAKGEANCST
jgi:hypothetical protein